MANIRQSREYAIFMERLGWKIEKIFNFQFSIFNYVYIRRFPLIGSFIKVLRIKPPIPFADVEKIAKKYRAFKVQIEAEESNNSNTVTTVTQKYKKYGYNLANNSLTPTKTILIDLTATEEKIFQSFSPEKRRAVRRAIKNKVTVEQSLNIESFIQLKNRQLWPFGFLLRNEIKKLWEVFSPKRKARLLLAYGESKPVAGVLLLFHDKVSYYWLASASNEGKKFFAPSLLVWEAINLSKKLDCMVFDFEGIYDERFKQTKNWQGFSNFKKGFGGKEAFYPSPYQKLFLPTL